MRSRRALLKLEVRPGETDPLTVWFDLDRDVKKTLYKRPAELRVHYRKGDKEEVASAGIIGGPLDTSAP
jgi:hypothetical protein